MNVPTPPNILFIICDDLAWGDLACQGNPFVHTPVLDRLQQQGTQLTRYCSGPLCTPARAALMTGRHPYRTRAIDTYLGRSLADPDEITLAKMFRQAGYRTGCFGKWHLGDCHPCRALDMGFDEAIVHNGGGLRQPGNFGFDGYFDPELMVQGKLTRRPGYCSDIFAADTIDFLRRSAGQPFFAYLAFNAPHSPFEIADEWWKKYARPDLPEKFSRIYGMVENIDHNVGLVLAELERLQLADHTIVIFTSDHGPCASANHEGKPRWNAGLRGIKGEMYEGGLRTPCLVRWPGHLAEGRKLDVLSNPIDWLPTLAACTGAQVPTDRVIDGIDLTPWLQAPPTDTPAAPLREICMQWQRGDIPQRYRNGAVLTQRYKWYWPEGANAPELYDLEQDPHETTDVADQQPELARHLRTVYERWYDDVSSTRGKTLEENYAPPRIIAGSPQENPTVLTAQDWRVYRVENLDWGPVNPGWWDITIASAGTFAIRVDLPPGFVGKELRFQAGDQTLKRTITGARADFQRVQLPAGPMRVEALIYEPAAGANVAPLLGVVRVWLERVG